MKILQHGNPEKVMEARKRHTTKFTCKNCDCVFEANRSEIKLIGDTKHDISTVRAICPECDCFCNVKFEPMRF